MGLSPAQQQQQQQQQRGIASASTHPSSSSSSDLQDMPVNAFAEHHLLEPSGPDVAASRQALQQFLSSQEFAALQANLLQQQQQQLKRGILVVAGGRKLTTHLVVLLKVGAWHMYSRHINC
jgi:3-phosphoglycerate kinase